MAGFLIGGVFWATLGLQALSGDGAPSAAPASAMPDARLPSPGCTSLALDRLKGHTSAEPCSGSALPLREARAVEPGDRL